MTRYILAPLLVIAGACATGDCDGKSPPAGDGPAVRTELPAQFVADRVVLVPTTATGERLELMTDSVGGMDQLYPATVQRLGLPTGPVDLPGLVEELGELATGTRQAQLPEFAPGRGIPAVRGMDGHLMVFPDRFLETQLLPGMARHDGFLGSRWFADQVWTWDYPAGRFFHEPDDYQPEPGAVAMPLGFRTNPIGMRVQSMPRMAITVDGRELPMLLDTGATTVLAPAALEALGDGGPAERATSMISDEVFQAWRQEHPEWRVIEGAQAGTGSDMIEVPEVDIAGFTVGPVWFTHRPNAPFHAMMSSMMDQRVEGAVGGNAFRHFVMTVDYPNAVAYFRCPGCDAPATGKPPAIPPPVP